MPPPLVPGRLHRLPAPPKARPRLVADGAYGEPVDQQIVTPEILYGVLHVLDPSQLDTPVTISPTILHGSLRFLGSQVTSGAVPRIRVMRISGRFSMEIITTIDGWTNVQGGYGEGPTAQAPTQPPGGAVVIEVEITNGAAPPPPSSFAIPWPSLPRFDPLGGVTLSVLDPNGDPTGVTDQALTRMALGLYRTTLLIPTTAESGFYGARITAYHADFQISQIYGLYFVKAEAD